MSFNIDEIKLINILKQILLEANTEKDISKGKKAEEYVDYINKQIKSYHSNNNVIRKIEEGQNDVIEINFDDLQIRLSNQRHEHDAQFKKVKNKDNQSVIYLFNCNIKETPLSVEYDESGLKHELTHFFDSQRGNFKAASDTQHKKMTTDDHSKNTDNYFNAPLEVNAYFFENIMPEVLKVIKKEKELPSNFEEFRKDLFNKNEIRSFYNKLNEKNKKKILKRLGTYYTDILTNPSFKVTKNDNQIDNSRLEKSTYGFVKKLKDKLGIFQE